MPKRKAIDEVETPSTTKKKSRTERLAEARARAAQWAKDEEAKKQTKTATKKAPTQKSTAPKARKATVKKTPVKSAPEKKESTPQSTKKSKAAKIAEARANAKAWAAAEEAKAVTKKTAAKAKVEVEKPQIPIPVKRVKAAQPNPYGRVPANKVNIGINHVPYDTKEVTQPNPYKASLPESSINPVINPIPFDTKEVSPDAGVSTVGKAKLFNNQPQSLLEKSGAVKEKSLSAIESANGTTNIDDNISKEEPSLAKRGRPYLTGIIILLVVAGFIATISTGKLNFVKEMLPDELTSFADTLPKELAKKLPKNLNDMVPKQAMTAMQSIVSKEQRAAPCYLDDYEFTEEEEKVRGKTTGLCDKTLDRVPCPEQGLCADGILHICLDANHTPSADGSECVWDERAKKSFATTEALLTNWTIQNYCKLSGAKSAHKSDTKAAVFPLSKVENENEIVQEMLSESKDFVLVEVNGEMMIGFSDTYVDTKLVLPTSCWMTLAILQTVSHFVASALGALVSVVTFVFEFAYAYPIIALVSLLLIMVVLYIRRQKKAQKELLENVATVRDMAFERMSLDASAHVVLHLRDAIAMEMHPMSRKGRSYIVLKVWPRVVADIRQDNRVLKTNRQVGGKPRDVWQWVASTPAK